MIRLATLGRLDLTRSDGTRIDSVLQQPKRVALLAFLVIEGGHIGREALMAMFWPEADDARARHCLKQSAYYLRQSLGAAMLVGGRTDHICLGPGSLSCDAVEFEQTCRRGEYAEALDLYGGDLLPGLFVSDSNEFDSWLAAQRARFRGLAIDAARHASHAALEGGDPAMAARLARRLMDLAGLDDAALREGMRLLAASGDHYGAGRSYAEFTRRVANELDLEPEAETDALARDLVAAGSPVAPVAPVAATAGKPAPGPPKGHGASAGPAAEGYGVVVAPVPADLSRRRGVWRAGRYTLAAVATLAALAWWAALRQQGGPRPPGDGSADPLVAVRAFDAVPGDEPAAALALVLPQLVRHHLAASRGIRVSAAGLAGPAPPPRGAGLAAFVLGGLVRSVDGETRIELELVDVESGDVVLTAPGPTAEEGIGADAVAHKVATLVRSALGREMRARERGSAVAPPDARELAELAVRTRRDARTLRAQGLAGTAATGLARADSLLALVEAAAPGWVDPIVDRALVAADLAWTALLPPVSDRTQAREHFERAFDTASRAVRHSPTVPGTLEARATMALRLLDFSDPDPRRGAALTDLARRDLERAVALDQRSVQAWSMLSDLAYRKGDFASAYWMARRAYELDRYLEDIQQVLLRLFASAHEVGDDAGARDWCDEIRRRFPGDATGIYCALAQVAWVDGPTADAVTRAWSLVEPLREHESHRPTLNRLEVMVGSVLARAGLADSAHAVIARARDRAGDDPEILHLEAHGHTLLGQPDSAAALLRSYVAGNPYRRAHLTRSRRFDRIASHIPVP